MTCGIYLIRHVESGLGYVGQSVAIEARLLVHARGKCRMRLGRSIAKYGWPAFRVEVLELCDRTSLNSREAHWIAALGTMSPGGFNLTSGGGQAGKWSPESLAKKSAASRARSPESFERSAEFHRGRRRSEETLRKLREVNLRVDRSAVSEETRRRLSAATSSPTAERRAQLSKQATEQWARWRAARKNGQPVA